MIVVGKILEVVHMFTVPSLEKLARYKVRQTAVYKQSELIGWIEWNRRQSASTFTFQH